MYLVGLTGGIASGKTVVADCFAHHGAEVIDADDVARDVVMPGTPAWSEIRAHFGWDILDDDGFIDRAALGRLVFTNPHKRALLNEITHPRIMRQIADRLEVLAPFGGVVVLDIPLLVETGVEESGAWAPLAAVEGITGYDAIVVVATRPETQLRRLVDWRGMSEADAAARIDAQAPLADKLAVATHVVWNEGSLDEVKARAHALAEEFNRAARKKATQHLGDVPDR